MLEKDMKEEIKRLTDVVAWQVTTIESLKEQVGKLEPEVIEFAKENGALSEQIKTQAIYTGKLEQIIAERDSTGVRLLDEITELKETVIQQKTDIDSLHSFFDSMVSYCGEKSDPLMTRLAHYLQGQIGR